VSRGRRVRWRYQRRIPDGRFTNRYDDQVVRPWREDAETFLNAGIGLVPLAPLTSVSEMDLPRIVGRMAERINVEPRPRAAKLWTATYLLMGLRYSEELTDSLLEGIQTMQASTTCQKTLREGRKEGRKEGRNEGRIAEARRMLLLLGTERFGDRDAATAARFEAIKDIDRLEALGERILDPEPRLGRAVAGSVTRGGSAGDVAWFWPTSVDTTFGRCV
jgi:predicted transposase YdaD